MSFRNVNIIGQLTWVAGLAFISGVRQFSSRKNWYSAKVLTYKLFRVCTRLTSTEELYRSHVPVDLSVYCKHSGISAFEMRVWKYFKKHLELKSWITNSRTQHHTSYWVKIYELSSLHQSSIHYPEQMNTDMFDLILVYSKQFWLSISSIMSLTNRDFHSQFLDIKLEIERSILYKINFFRKISL